MKKQTKKQTKQTTAKKPGRKTKKIPKYIDPLLDNLRAGLPIHVAASQAGLTARTVHRWTVEDEAFAEEYQAAIDYSEATLLAEVRRLGNLKEDWRAPLAILERRFPERWSLKRDIDVKVAKSNDGAELVASMLAQATAALTNETIEQDDIESNDD